MYPAREFENLDSHRLKLFATQGGDMRHMAMWSDPVYERALDHLENMQSDRPWVHIDMGGLNLCGHEGASVEPGRASGATCPDCRSRQEEWRL